MTMTHHKCIRTVDRTTNTSVWFNKENKDSRDTKYSTSRNSVLKFVGGCFVGGLSCVFIKGFLLIDVEIGVFYRSSETHVKEFSTSPKLVTFPRV